MRVALLQAVFLFLLPILQPLGAQTVNEPLPPWHPGGLDIHQISTGRGNAAFLILPDGTTLLVDAGDAGEGILYADPVPDGSRRPGEWIARYIKRAIPQGALQQIDYALLTHFHADHMGRGTEQHPLSKSGAYRLSGITEVAESIPVRTVIDRGWPDYAYPIPLDFPSIDNYRRFLEIQQSQNSLTVERLQPGRRDQIVLRRTPEAYPTFEIRNLAANGEIWTGVGDQTRRQFPALATLAREDYPTENMCSLALRIRYGAFDYYTGGDLPGLPDPGFPDWGDVETPIARAIGAVEVHVVNHHGSIDPANPFFLATLRPQIHILPAWAPSHPAPGVLKRLLSKRIYPDPRAVFATRIREPTRAVIGRRIEELSSSQGHIVLRVEPGGARFQVLILDDSIEEGRVISIHGPYQSS